MSKHSGRPPAKQTTVIPPRDLINGYVAIKHCRHGVMMYNLNDLFVGRAMDLYGEWCENELAALGQLIRPGDTVIDVGANIGTHTVFFSKKVAADGIVYALEPQRITYEFLCANLALNGLVNVIPMQIAVGNQTGRVNIPVLDPGSPQNFAAMQVEGHHSGDMVPLLPLDTLDLQRCNLIKIDVEGMELKVLLGAEKTIRSRRPFLFVENNTDNGSPETVQALFDMGYLCWWHISNYFNPDNFFHNKDNIFANYIPESNMICAPKELNMNVSGFEPVTGPNDTWVQALTRLGVIKAPTA